jgi:hypothetical protein
MCLRPLSLTRLRMDPEGHFVARDTVARL